ncbi:MULTISPECIES: hypothetical protein [Brenneria]|uniref:Uncharacterized protein n=1 Tax=Brenneria nigrifluens DSM 30175 = ATCC 13028 TaxID=1121120 RepID=A0ABX5UYS7_9GAMM|nr:MULTISPECIES: hypothetical protein [Brenneria]QCR03843.1 hypothetical protein EH206_06400 [Brenneria nigrifluens DSM 30175 = ATCC 13028]
MKIQSADGVAADFLLSAVCGDMQHAASGARKIILPGVSVEARALSPRFYVIDQDNGYCSLIVRAGRKIDDKMRALMVRINGGKNEI